MKQEQAGNEGSTLPFHVFIFHTFFFTDKIPLTPDYFEEMTKSKAGKLMENLNMCKTVGFSNVCKLFVRGCGCASFDCIYYSGSINIKTSCRKVSSEVLDHTS